jgi:hypothetical protein
MEARPLLSVLFLFVVTMGTHSLAQQSGQSRAEQAPSPEAMDKLLAPIALYPDALLAQVLECSTSPFQVTAIVEWFEKNQNLKGSELQEAAQNEGFGPSFVALVPFGQVLNMMAEQIDWTRQLGEAFTRHRQAVFDSAQRLRAQAKAAGNLKSTEQQEVKTETTESGQEVIVIQPANPQVIYVPVYNTQVVYTQPPPSTTTVVVEDNSSDAAAAAVVGFTVGIVIGAAASNSYYYGPYGWHGGGAYWYGRAWDDYYDHREDMREDWYDHREDLGEERTERREEYGQERTERQSTRQEEAAGRETSRQDEAAGRQASRQEGQARTQAATASEGAAASRQQGATREQASQQRSQKRELRGPGPRKQDRPASRVPIREALDRGAVRVARVLATMNLADTRGALRCRRREAAQARVLFPAMEVVAQRAPPVRAAEAACAEALEAGGAEVAHSCHVFEPCGYPSTE